MVIAVVARRAVRYDISYDPQRGRWYLHASWKTTPHPRPGSMNCAGGGARGGPQRRSCGRLCARQVGQSDRCTSDHPRRHRRVEDFTAGWSGAHSDNRLARPRPAAELLGDRGGEPRLCRRARYRARDSRQGQTGQAIAPHRGRDPHSPVSGSAGGDGRPARHRGDRGGPRLYQPMGQPALA